MKKRYIVGKWSIIEVDGDAADGRKIVKTARQYGKWDGDAVTLIEGEEIQFDANGNATNIIAKAIHSLEKRDYIRVTV